MGERTGHPLGEPPRQAPERPAFIQKGIRQIEDDPGSRRCTDPSCDIDLRREDDQVQALPVHGQLELDATRRGVSGKPSSITRNRQVRRERHIPDPAAGPRSPSHRSQSRTFPARSMNGRRLSLVVGMGPWSVA